MVGFAVATKREDEWDAVEVLGQLFVEMEKRARVRVDNREERVKSLRQVVFEGSGFIILVVRVHGGSSRRREDRREEKERVLWFLGVRDAI